MNEDQTAIQLLTQDHRQVESIFNELLSLDKEKPTEIFACYYKLFTLLLAHTQIEEAMLYPLASQKLGNPEIMLEAIIEHAQVKNMMIHLQAMNLIGDYGSLWKAKIKVLMDLTLHHVQEEETEMFPKLEEKMNQQELLDLGQKIMKAKDKLIQTSIEVAELV